VKNIIDKTYTRSPLNQTEINESNYRNKLYKECILEIVKGKHTFSCEAINFADWSMAKGIKSHKKNKLRRRRTYKRGKEEQFLPTPTKTHKRRHIKTPLERLRAKLQPKSTRRRRTRA
jgi:hypothetical protein